MTILTLHTTLPVSLLASHWSGVIITGFSLADEQRRHTWAQHCHGVISSQTIITPQTPDQLHLHTFKYFHFPTEQARSQWSTLSIPCLHINISLQGWRHRPDINITPHTRLSMSTQHQHVLSPGSPLPRPLLSDI